MNNNVNDRTINIKDIKRTIYESVSYLKQARKQTGLTISELSKKSGVSVGTICELEKSVSDNKNKDNEKKIIPTLVNFIALTQALNMSEEFVLGTILDFKLYDNRNNVDKISIIKNNLNDYGIHDTDSIDFIINTIEFIKNRTRNKKI